MLQLTEQVLHSSTQLDKTLWATKCVHPLQGAGSKQGNLGRPPVYEQREQREERNLKPGVG